MTQRDTLQMQIMEVSLNLARVGDWAAENFEGRKALITRFITQTD